MSDDGLRKTRCAKNEIFVNFRMAQAKISLAARPLSQSSSTRKATFNFNFKFPHELIREQKINLITRARAILRVRNSRNTIRVKSYLFLIATTTITRTQPKSKLSTYEKFSKLWNHTSPVQRK